MTMMIERENTFFGKCNRNSYYVAEFQRIPTTLFIIILFQLLIKIIKN